MTNVSYYTNARAATVEFQQNNQERRNKNYILRPLERYFVDPVAKCVAQQVIVPAFEALYFLSGYAAVKTLEKIRPAHAERLNIAWVDPVSTEWLLRLASRIRKLSLFLGNRKPASLPLVEYPDACLIVAARHTYILANDVSHLLSLPSLFREKAECLLAQEDIKSLPWYSSWIAQAKNATKEALLQHSLLLVDEKEKALRLFIVGKTVHAVFQKSVELTLKWLLRASIGMLFYELMKRSLSQDDHLSKKAIETISLFLTLGGIYLWLRCLTPTVQRLYHARELSFNPKASTVQELLTLLSIKASLITSPTKQASLCL